MKKLFLSIQCWEETSVEKKNSHASINRREFIKFLTVSAVGGKALLSQERPPMTYRRLGRTGFMSSRLVFGGGAALAGGKGVRLLDRALEAGINHFDVGSNVYYRGAERSLAPFLKINRGKVWVASKAPLMIRGHDHGGASQIRSRQLDKIDGCQLERPRSGLYRPLLSHGR